MQEPSNGLWGCRTTVTIVVLGETIEFQMSRISISERWGQDWDIRFLEAEQHNWIVRVRQETLNKGHNC